MRYTAFDDVAHVLPIRHLVSRSLTLRKLDLPISHNHLIMLVSVELLDNFIIFLLLGFNGIVNLRGTFKRVVAHTRADLSGLRLYRADYKRVQGCS